MQRKLAICAALLSAVSVGAVRIGDEEPGHAKRHEAGKHADALLGQDDKNKKDKAEQPWGGAGNGWGARGAGWGAGRWGAGSAGYGGGRGWGGRGAWGGRGGWGGGWAAGAGYGGYAGAAGPAGPAGAVYDGAGPGYGGAGPGYAGAGAGYAGAGAGYAGAGAGYAGYGYGGYGGPATVVQKTVTSDVYAPPVVAPVAAVATRHVSTWGSLEEEAPNKDSKKGLKQKASQDPQAEPLEEDDMAGVADEKSQPQHADAAEDALQEVSAGHKSKHQAGKAMSSKDPFEP
eukprot:TRINITY_DN9026_c0_g1_i1.p1 TRINITY_DN9026_c0_g1~~TRINITY_DN9026_c0_g1_i1.p1  ORF type:complete len:309 (-),score=70.12 TRINITY_DN9026_c0_g1_i1:256-1116(-)